MPPKKGAENPGPTSELIKALNGLMKHDSAIIPHVSPVIQKLHVRFYVDA